MRGRPACPFCESGCVERVGRWGGQMITAQWRCTACGSYFEAIREEPAEAARTDSRLADSNLEPGPGFMPPAA
jgi:transposase-like protein